MPKTLRFSLLVWLCVVLCFGGLSCKSESAAPDKSWPTAPPEEQGFDSAELAGVVEEIDQQDLPVDSLQIVRNGVLILDAYFYPYLGDRPEHGRIISGARARSAVRRQGRHRASSSLDDDLRSRLRPVTGGAGTQ